MIENVGCRETQFQVLRFFYLDGFVERHVHIHCVRANDDVASGIAEGACWVGEGRSVEPVQDGGIANLYRLARNYIGPVCSSDSALDVGYVVEDSGAKRKARGCTDITAQCESAEYLGWPTAVMQPLAVFAYWQIVVVIGSQAMALVEARKSALSCEVLVILRDDRGASTNGRSIVNGFGIGVSAAQRESMAHALTNSQRARVQNR